MQYTLSQAIYYFTNFIYILILLRVLISWFRISENNAIVRLLYVLTEPILSPIRSLIRKSPLGGPGMVLDFSPIIAYFLVMLIRQLLLELVSIIF